LTTYRPGTTVRYSHAAENEAALAFTLIEDKGEPAWLVESRDFPDWRIAPREVVSIVRSHRDSTAPTAATAHATTTNASRSVPRNNPAAVSLGEG
jgi:hypothetical protein